MGRWVLIIEIEMEDLKREARIRGVIKLLISRSKEKIPSKKRKKTPLSLRLIFTQR